MNTSSSTLNTSSDSSVTRNVDSTSQRHKPSIFSVSSLLSNDEKSGIHFVLTHQKARPFFICD